MARSRRISPEAPAPVLAVKRSEIAIGGAGNVARNVASLGARCIFVGMVGADDAARDVIARLQADPLIEPSLVIDPTRPTTRKVRFVSEHFSTHLLRADWEQAGPVSADLEGDIIARALAALPRAGAVVLSDYAKGVLTPRVIAEVIGAANKAGMPVIVDPKAADYAVYRGATVIKPNRKELAETHAAYGAFRRGHRRRRRRSSTSNSARRRCWCRSATKDSCWCRRVARRSAFPPIRSR